MATIVNKNTFQVIESVNTPDFDPALWLINPDLTLLKELGSDAVKVVGDIIVAKTEEELLESFNTRLDKAKATKLKIINDEIQGYLEFHYSSYQLQIFTILCIQSKSSVEMRNSIQPLWAWICSVRDNLNKLSEDVSTAETIEGVKAIVFDAKAFDATDPKLKIEDM